MAANPLSAAAGYFAIKEIEKKGCLHSRRKGGGQACQGAQRPHRKILSPLRRLQPGIDLPPRDGRAMFIKINYLKILDVLKEIKTRKLMMEEYGQPTWPRE